MVPQLSAAAASSVRPPTLSARGLTIRAGTRELVRALDLDIAPGELLAVLGGNGSGKTLTLHTLAGLRAPAAGELRLAGTPLRQLTRRHIARHVGLLPQDLEEGFVSTALESVLIGRHPHLALWQWESAQDERLARAALERVGLAGFEQRRTDTLSGGEQRRVAIASLIAQQPGIYLLDEPTNHLDPQHQLAVLGLFRQLAHDGAAVVTTLHDPTLAARFADRALLLYGDVQDGDGPGGSARWRAGAAGELLTAAQLSALYRAPMIELERDGRRIFAHA